jgi:hypothetical protein
MVYGTNPKWISNLRTFGEMAIIARHSDKKIRSKLSDRGNVVMFVGYSDIHEKDVYQFMNIATKKTMLSRDVIWLNKTYSQYMGISQVDYVSSEVEEEEGDLEEEEAHELEEDGHVGPPPTITEEDHIEQIMDAPKAEPSPEIVAPYPTSTRQLRSSVIPKKMSREVRNLQSNHVAFITHTVPEPKDQVYRKELAMIQAAFNSVSGFEER